MSASSLTGHLQRGDRVFVAGLSGESALLREELLHAPDRAAGVEFTSIQLPGIDRTDFLSFHPESSTRSFFMTPGTRAGVAAGRSALHPLDYLGVARYLLEAQPFDTAIAQFTPPDENGWCSPGLTADFLPLVWRRAKRRIGHLNPQLPRLDSSFRAHVSEFDSVVEADAPVLEVPEAPATATGERIGRHAAALIRDGDTLQFGIGSVLPDICRALHSHRELRIHTGVISDVVQTMWESGALQRDARIVTGVVFGDRGFHEYLARMGSVYLDDVRQTHGFPAVSAVHRLVAINSAVEVDLFGQVNSERSNGTLQAGAGGLPAYAHAAQNSPDGRLLICLPATARAGKTSRIVPSLDAKGICTVPRHLADTVVTEFGAATLRGLSIEERANALIGIAHPDHRGHLAEQWELIQRTL